MNSSISFKNKMKTGFLEQLKNNNIFDYLTSHTKEDIEKIITTNKTLTNSSDTILNTTKKIFSLPIYGLDKIKDTKEGELYELIEALDGKKIINILEEISDIIYYLTKHKEETYTKSMREIKFFIDDLISELGLDIDFFYSISYNKFSGRQFSSKYFGDYIAQKERKKILKPIEKKLIKSICDNYKNEKKQKRLLNKTFLENIEIWKKRAINLLLKYKRYNIKRVVNWRNDVI